jgi:hypothetical protein
MTNAELEQKVSKLTELVETLVNNVPKKEIVPQETPKSEDESIVIRELGGPSENFPYEYRAVVDRILNKNFGIHVKSDIGSFIFTVLVPKKYSSMTDEAWKVYHFDKRVKVIPNVEGIEGVKMWVDKVFSSFTPEYQSLIVADRVANP